MGLTLKQLTSTVSQVKDYVDDKVAGSSSGVQINDESTTSTTETWSAKKIAESIPTSLPANGGNAQTVNKHTVQSDVPENAKFTDTLYDDADIKLEISKKANVDDLAQYATKQYVGEQIASVDHLKREIVTVLPSGYEADENTIYMIKDASAHGDDHYREYMLIDGNIECIGDTSVDLREYAQTTYVDDEIRKLDNKIDGLDIPEAVSIATDTVAGIIKTGYKRTDENKYCNPVTVDADGNAYVDTLHASNARYADKVQDESNYEMNVLLRSSDSLGPEAFAVWERVNETHNAISAMSKDKAKEWLGVPTIGAGTLPGSIGVTTKSGTEDVLVHGLGTAAFTDSNNYAVKGHSHSSINNEITFSNFIHSASPICFYREDLEDIHEHSPITYDNTVLNKNAYGYIFTDQIDEGYMNYVAIGKYSEHDFMSYDTQGRMLGVPVSISAGIVSAKTFNNVGGDYAEYWEWEDGNIQLEDRVGHFVTFHKNKIRLSIDGDNTCKVGVVSANPSIIGDSDNKDWRKKYQTDIFGRVLYEDVEDENGNMIHRMKLNPEYDETQPYIKRKDRPEWDPIGTHGKLVVIDDGTCVEDSFCRPTDGGIATAADDGFYVMERLDDNHIRIYMK